MYYVLHRMYAKNCSSNDQMNIDKSEMQTSTPLPSNSGHPIWLRQHINTSWSPGLVPRLSCEGGDSHAWEPRNKASWKPKPPHSDLPWSQSVLPQIHWTEMWHDHLLDALIHSLFSKCEILPSGSLPNLWFVHIALKCRCKCCRHMHIGKFALITAWNTKILPLCWNYHNSYHSWIVHRYVSITLFSRIPVKDLQNVSTRCNIRCRLQQSHNYKIQTATVPQLRCRLQQSHN